MTTAKKTLSRLNSLKIEKFQSVVTKLFSKMDFTIHQFTIVDNDNLNSILLKEREFGGKTHYFVHVFRGEREISAEDMSRAFTSSFPPDTNRFVAAATSNFSQSAQQYANKHKISLKDGLEFYEMLKKYELFRPKEKTPEKTAQKAVPEAIPDSAPMVTMVTFADHMNQTQAYVDRGNHSAALKSVNDALSLERQSLPAQIMKAQILYHLGQLETAFEFNNQLLRENPGNDEIMLVHARILRSLGRNESALTYVERALEQHPLNLDLMIEKGLIYKNLQNYERAVSCYNKAIMNDPNNWNAWYLKGICLALSGKFNESVRSFEEALLISPESLDVLLAKRDVLQKLKEQEDLQNRNHFYTTFRRGSTDTYKKVWYTGRGHLEQKWKKVHSHEDSGQVSFTQHYITFEGKDHQIEIGTDFDLEQKVDNINSFIVWKEVTYRDANNVRQIHYFAEVTSRVQGFFHGKKKEDSAHHDNLFQAFEDWKRLKSEEATFFREKLNDINRAVELLEQRKEEEARLRQLDLQRLKEEEVRRRAEEEQRLAIMMEERRRREEANAEANAEAARRDRIKEEQKEKAKHRVKRCPQCKKGKIVIPAVVKAPIVIQCDNCSKKFSFKPKEQ